MVNSGAGSLVNHNAGLSNGPKMGNSIVSPSGQPQYTSESQVWIRNALVSLSRKSI